MTEATNKFPRKGAPASEAMEPFVIDETDYSKRSVSCCAHCCSYINDVPYQLDFWRRGYSRTTKSSGQYCSTSEAEAAEEQTKAVAAAATAVYGCSRSGCSIRYCSAQCAERDDRVNGHWVVCCGRRLKTKRLITKRSTCVAGDDEKDANNNNNNNNEEDDDDDDDWQSSITSEFSKYVRRHSSSQLLRVGFKVVAKLFARAVEDNHSSLEHSYDKFASLFGIIDHHHQGLDEEGGEGEIEQEKYEKNSSNSFSTNNSTEESRERREKMMGSRLNIKHCSPHRSSRIISKAEEQLPVDALAVEESFGMILMILSHEKSRRPVWTATISGCEANRHSAGSVEFVQRNALSTGIATDASSSSFAKIGNPPRSPTITQRCVGSTFTMRMWQSILCVVDECLIAINTPSPIIRSVASLPDIAQFNDRKDALTMYKDLLAPSTAFLEKQEQQRGSNNSRSSSSNSNNRARKSNSSSFSSSCMGRTLVARSRTLTTVGGGDDDDDDDNRYIEYYASYDHTEVGASARTGSTGSTGDDDDDVRSSVVTMSQIERGVTRLAQCASICKPEQHQQSRSSARDNGTSNPFDRFHFVAMVLVPLICLRSQSSSSSSSSSPSRSICSNDLRTSVTGRSVERKNQATICVGTEKARGISGDSLLPVKVQYSCVGNTDLEAFYCCCGTIVEDGKNSTTTATAAAVLATLPSVLKVRLVALWDTYGEENEKEDEQEDGKVTVPVLTYTHPFVNEAVVREQLLLADGGVSGGGGGGATNKSGGGGEGFVSRRGKSERHEDDYYRYENTREEEAITSAAKVQEKKGVSSAGRTAAATTAVGLTACSPSVVCSCALCAYCANPCEVLSVAASATTAAAASFYRTATTTTRMTRTMSAHSNDDPTLDSSSVHHKNLTKDRKRKLESPSRCNSGCSIDFAVSSTEDVNTGDDAFVNSCDDGTLWTRATSTSSSSYVIKQSAEEKQEQQRQKKLKYCQSNSSSSSSSSTSALAKPLLPAADHYAASALCVSTRQRIEYLLLGVNPSFVRSGISTLSTSESSSAIPFDATIRTLVLEVIKNMSVYKNEKESIVSTTHIGGIENNCHNNNNNNRNSTESKSRAVDDHRNRAFVSDATKVLRALYRKLKRLKVLADCYMSGTVSATPTRKRIRVFPGTTPYAAATLTAATAESYQNSDTTTTSSSPCCRLCIAARTEANNNNNNNNRDRICYHYFRWRQDNATMSAVGIGSGNSNKISTSASGNNPLQQEGIFLYCFVIQLYVDLCSSINTGGDSTGDSTGGSCSSCNISRDHNSTDRGTEEGHGNSIAELLLVRADLDTLVGDIVLGLGTVLLDVATTPGHDPPSPPSTTNTNNTNTTSQSSSTFFSSAAATAIAHSISINKDRSACWLIAHHIWCLGSSCFPSHAQLKEHSQKVLAYDVHYPSVAATATATTTTTTATAATGTTTTRRSTSSSSSSSSTPVTNTLRVKSTSDSVWNSQDVNRDAGSVAGATEIEIVKVNVGRDAASATATATAACDTLIAQSCSAVLTAEECNEGIQLALDYTKSVGGWTTSRHYAVPTTDVAVHAYRPLLLWFNRLMETRFVPFLTNVYLRQQRELHQCIPRIAVHDAFVVKYQVIDDHCSAEKDDEEIEDEEEEEEESNNKGAMNATANYISNLKLKKKKKKPSQRYLPLHSDQSTHSLTVALNSKGEYVGGGTYFTELKKALRPNKGEVLSFCGELLHGGDPLLSGTRYVLVVFLLLDSCSYSPRPVANTGAAAIASSAAISGRDVESTSFTGDTTSGGSGSVLDKCVGNISGPFSATGLSKSFATADGAAAAGEVIDNVSATVKTEGGSHSFSFNFSSFS